MSALCAVYGCNNYQNKVREEGIVYHRFLLGKKCIHSEKKKVDLWFPARGNKLIQTAAVYVLQISMTERHLQNELLGLPLGKDLKKTAVSTLSLFKRIPKPVTAREEKIQKKNEQEMVNKFPSQSTDNTLINPNLISASTTSRCIENSDTSALLSSVSLDSPYERI